MTVRYSAQMILNKSYKLFNKNGLDNLKVYTITHACHCSTTPIYYSFKSQKAVLELAYHDFEEKLATEVKAEEVQFSNHEPYWYFYRVLLSCPGLVKEVSVNNKQVIRTLTEISQNYFPNNLLATLAANILLVGIALNFKERSNLSFLTFSNVVENLLRNLKRNIEDV
ncbi:TetR/AcrR family transcriptional regulator [Lactobacillus intestinalis]|uniref:TetR/AcrR family transcriptional regulator n=1 Tax=Lactobacillus intestinalis TaxID=151781 RepID=UPI002636B5E1|nr:TetR/AcrR family transcriptional regulator [Lactobacillus intestinalis]